MVEIRIWRYIDIHILYMYIHTCIYMLIDDVLILFIVFLMFWRFVKTSQNVALKLTSEVQFYFVILTSISHYLKNKCRVFQKYYIFMPLVLQIAKSFSIKFFLIIYEAKYKLKQLLLVVTCSYSHILTKHILNYFMWPPLAHYEKSKTIITKIILSCFLK